MNIIPLMHLEGAMLLKSFYLRICLFTSIFFVEIEITLQALFGDFQHA